MTMQEKIALKKEEIWKSLRPYHGKPVIFEEYRFPEIDITAFNPNPDEPTRGLAKILVSIEKNHATRIRREINSDGSVAREMSIIFDNLGEYWFKGTDNMLKHPTIQLSEKAYMLLQLKENLNRLYQNEYSSETQKTSMLIDDLIQDLLTESRQTKEESRFSVGIDRTKTIMPELKNAKNINVINFFRNLFFNEKVYNKINCTMEKPCQVEIVAEIEYQK